MNPSAPRTRTLRLASGLVLLAYVATHLLNHSLGLVSLAAAEAGREVFLAVWRNPAGTAAFYGALLLHVGLALSALYERRTLRMPALELTRIALGFTIPLLLALHMVGTRLVYELSGVQDTYARVSASLWGNDASLRQATLMTVAWLHGCLGIHLWLRHRAEYRRRQVLLVVVATLLPALAFTGYLAMARAAPPLSPADAAAIAPYQAQLELATLLVFYTPLVLLAATLCARWMQLAWARRNRRMVRIAYPSRAVEVPAGFSVLEASRAHGVPHLSLCGGRARCSTCRVRVVSSRAALPAPGADEAETLQRIGAASDVRLACQLRPTCSIEVEPMLATRGAAPATEREIVVMFADLRRWTTISQRQLPFDLVYVLDRYFEAVGDAVREAGGIPNQFIGDSVMALFGTETDVRTAAQQALDAATRIEQRMELLNATLEQEFGRRLDFGIGIHAGSAVVGTVGYRDTRTLTAVGDAVNTASRLQDLTKLLGARLVVSQAAMEHAGEAAGDGWQRHEVPIRGREGTLVVFARGEPSDGLRRSTAPSSPRTSPGP